ncbi:MAG: hypothetical protein ACW968_15120 [Candidatus Thorarchaeota archaeon]|jgi:hypothetical protein
MSGETKQIITLKTVKDIVGELAQANWEEKGLPCPECPVLAELIRKLSIALAQESEKAIDDQ